jgi:hypothetical protein
MEPISKYIHDFLTNIFKKYVKINFNIDNNRIYIDITNHNNKREMNRLMQIMKDHDKTQDDNEFCNNITKMFNRLTDKKIKIYDNPLFLDTFSIIKFKNVLKENKISFNYFIDKSDIYNKKFIAIP